MKPTTPLITISASAALLLCMEHVWADFSGPYAPGGWTFTANGGDGSFLNDGSTLALTGNDDGFGPTDTDYTIASAAGGTLSFDWSYDSIDSATFDSGGYLLNGAYTELANNGAFGSPPVGGTVSIPVNPGDIIGFRVHSADGQFGPGVLTITTFGGPLPPPTVTFGGPIPPLAIPDGVVCGTSGPPVSTSISIPQSGTIVDVDVVVDIAHTWYGDIRLELTHGSETAILAGQQAPDDSSNLGGAYTLDDEAAVTWDAASAGGDTLYLIPPGSYRPDNGGPASAMSNFDGTDLQGTWTLTASDWCGADVGSISGFALIITYVPAPTALTLNADATCYEPGDTVTVTIDVSGLPVSCAGGQFFLNFDPATLDFVSAEPGDDGSDPLNPFELEIYECEGQTILGVCTTGVPPGRLDYAVGTAGGFGSGSAADNTMAVIEFIALTEVCDVPNLVRFRDNVSGPLNPPTRISDEFGITISSNLIDMVAITVDDTPPAFVNVCPLPDISVNADAGTCEAAYSTVNAAGPVVTPTATDSCSSTTVTFVRSDGKLLLTDAYEAADSPIIITWTATDLCNNSTTCTQTVNVDAENELLLTLQLSPNIAPTGSLTRCIRLEFWTCAPNVSVVVDVPVTFTVSPGSPNTAIATFALVEIPCGAYTCVTARDRLHTLRRTADGGGGNFGIVGTQYLATFVDDPYDVTPGGDWLVGGNLNDDQYIDILDFGVFVSQYPIVYGPNGNTTCSTPFPHADISGNGNANAADFTFIQVNFLKLNDGNCCTGVPDSADDGGGFGVALGNVEPITRISVKELIRRGLRDLAVADLNRDGWLDTLDVDAFVAGGN